MRGTILGILGAGLLAGPMVAEAFTISTATCNGTQTCVTGISGLNVGGTLLDFAPVYGPVETTPGAKYFFGNSAGASAAATAIFGALNGNGFAGLLVPGNPSGAIPVSSAIVAYSNPIAGWLVGPEYEPSFGGSGCCRDPNSFWTAAPSPVPLPAAAWLLLSGLGALGFIRRRRKAA